MQCAGQNDNRSSGTVQRLSARNRRYAHFHAGRRRYAAGQVRRLGERARLQPTLLQAGELQSNRLFQRQGHGGSRRQGAGRGRRYDCVRLHRQHQRIRRRIRRALRACHRHTCPQRLRRARQNGAGDNLRRADHAYRRRLRRRPQHRAPTQRQASRRAGQFAQPV